MSRNSVEMSLTGGAGEWLDAQDVARRLGIHRLTVYELCRRGELGHYQMGKRYRFRSSQVDEYLERHRVPVRAERRNGQGEYPSSEDAQCVTRE